MRVLRFLIILSCCFCINARAQLTEQMQTVSNKYSNYYKEEKEAFYTHFNKAVYFTGENIWFKVYVLNYVTRQPFFATRTLHTELYDSKGKLVGKKLLYVTEATTNGDFRLGNNLPAGTYTFRAYTNWSKNFGENFYYTQPITVLSKLPAVENKKQSAQKLDVQVFPEGGSFVADVKNTIAFKVTGSDGFGMQTEGTLKLNGQPLQKISANQFGLGRFNLVPKVGNVYSAVFLTGSKDSVTIELPKPLEKGIVFSADAISRDTVMVNVIANTTALGEIRGKDFYIMVHRQGSGQIITGKFGVSNKFYIPQSYFPQGVAHLTLFDENSKPIADRAVFIPFEKASLMADAKREGDSVVIEFKTEDAAKPVSSNISVSLLPAGTIADEFYTNIYSRYFLEGDIKGFIEQPSYYFEGDWQNRMQDMDNLMLVHGWRSYDWNTVLNSEPKKPAYQFHHGFTIKGTIPSYRLSGEKDSTTLSLFSPANNIFLSTKVQRDGSFDFPYLYLRDSSQVVLNTKDAKWKHQVKNITTEVVGISFDSLVHITPIQYAKNKVVDEQSFLFEEGKTLDEVVVQAKVSDQKLFKNDHLVSLGDKAYKIDAKAIQRHRNLTDLLRAQFGLIVDEQLGTGEIKVRIVSGPFSINSPDLPPVLIIDGQEMSNFNMLRMMKVEDVEAIAVSKANTMLGSRGAGGSIVIKTRLSDDNIMETAENGFVSMLVKGYDNPSNYFSPIYAVSYTSPLFTRYGSLHWEPKIITDINGKNSIKFYLPKELKGFKLRAEGITVNGGLLYREKEFRF